MTDLKVGDRVVYTGTMSSNRIGKHGTVARIRESFDRDKHLVAEIQWDDQPPPARPKGHYFTNLTLLQTIPTLRSTWETR
jgi:hypothetical protein